MTYDPAVFDAAYDLVDYVREELPWFPSRIGRRIGRRLAGLSDAQLKAFYDKVDEIVSAPWLSAELRPVAGMIRRLAHRYAWERAQVG